mmetsp:Transcript_91945/g.126792  ORF Transcript_91945/g.126792 Transcript_91945/m.126792 type:complete len:92 (+) Transcript_91945:453-728(+)
MTDNDTYYAIGGQIPKDFYRSDPSKACSVISIPNKSIRYVQPMLIGRFAHQVCYLNGYIYAMGGKDENSRTLKSCEKYSIKEDKWTAISDS